jgi:hypothetical protein
MDSFLKISKDSFLRRFLEPTLKIFDIPVEQKPAN